MGRKESELTVNTTMSASDLVRIVADAASRTISLTNLGAAMQSILEALGFLTATSITAGIANKHKITRINTNYGLLDTDDVVLADVSGGDITINLMAASAVWDAAESKGQVFTVKLELVSSTNKAIIDPASTELIDAASTFELIGPNKVFAQFISDGSNWHVIGG